MFSRSDEKQVGCLHEDRNQIALYYEKDIRFKPFEYQYEACYVVAETCFLVLTNSILSFVYVGKNFEKNLLVN